MSAVEGSSTFDVTAANSPKQAHAATANQPQLLQPPLPAEPPPAPQHHPHQPAPHYVQQPYAPNQTSWQQDGYFMNHNVDIPPISNLLLREADAWRAVLGLHAGVVTSAQQAARSTDNGGDNLIDEKRLHSDAREAAYCSALTSLASQCDALFNEVMKLRAFRKARRAVEVQCVNELMRSHCDEVLAIGQTLSSNGALNVSSATSELRLVVQTQRNQVSQLRVFLEAVKAASSMPLPSGSKLVIGVRTEEGERGMRDLDDVFKEIYRVSRELNESSLTAALSRMFLDDGKSEESAPAPSRQFARRSVDREVALSQLQQ